MHYSHVLIIRGPSLFRVKSVTASLLKEKGGRKKP
jgi:hypothetical protein